MDDLLKPRYQVICDYPDRAFEMNLALEYNVVDSCFENSAASGQTIEPEKYPHIFKKLQWWEKRNINELPNYIQQLSIFEKHKKWKVSEYVIDFELNPAQTFDGPYAITDNSQKFQIELKMTIPITEDEYHSQENHQ